MDVDSQNPSRIDELRSLTFGFDELPLEHFRGMTAAEIEAHPGIGPKYRERIQAALAELSSLTGEDYGARDDSSPAPATESAHLEPVSPGTSGPLAVLGVVVVVALIAVLAVLFATKGLSRQQQEELSRAKTEVGTARHVLFTIGSSSAQQALGHATDVFRKAQEGNYGDARQHLAYVRAALETVEEAGSLALTDVTARQRVALAKQAADEAETALLLSQPLTHEQVLSAVNALVQAVNALGGDEVKD